MINKIPSDYEIYLFHEGSLIHSYNTLGAHLINDSFLKGVRFTLWAPNAKEVRVIGDFNNWQGQKHIMKKISHSGIWSLFIPNLQKGDLYKFEIHTNYGEVIEKADPYAFYSELRPLSASIIYDLDNYKWQDEKWQKENKKSIYERPVNIYEVHLGSWKVKKNGEFYTYRELADELVNYVYDMGYTHIELLPVMEHPFDGSWGYQITGYYSVTSRYGKPEDFKYFIDMCHEKGIGVILDWVPAHFCKDGHGLARFDGTSLYEKEENSQWGTLNFDFGRPEVKSFLISNAIFWLSEYHIDGLRVDAVASMLYLDYGKDEGSWQPNKFGGRENLEAVDFMKKLNKAVFEHFPNTLMLAEESTEWPLVTGPTHLGGLGYNYKWNMGWMNDVLKYMEMDPIYRKWHHNLLTFSFMYAFSENFVLPLSHDEVVHGKRSLIEKMPGDYWRKFANLRTLLSYMLAHPGKKLLFMGGEFAQFIEWRFYEQLEWFLLDIEMHKSFHKFVKKLNYFYLREKCLWEKDHNWDGFEWIDANNFNQSIIVFMRMDKNKRDFVITVCNFTPVVYDNYRIGVPRLGQYKEVFNSDEQIFGGSGQKNKENLIAEDLCWHNQPFSLKIKVPPLAVVFLKIDESININKEAL